MTVLIGEWFCLTWRSERRADDDPYGAGADPVGGIIGVAPERVGGKPAPVVGPYCGINVIVAKGAVHVRPSPNPAIGVRCGGGKCALLGAGHCRRDKISEGTNGRIFSESMALALVDDDDNSWRADIGGPIRLSGQVRQKECQYSPKN